MCVHREVRRTDDALGTQDPGRGRHIYGPVTRNSRRDEMRWKGCDSHAVYTIRGKGFFYKNVWKSVGQLLELQRSERILQP